LGSVDRLAGHSFRDSTETSTERRAKKITPGGTLTTLHSFRSETRCQNGSTPYAGLILGTDGNFYGTTTTDGAGEGGHKDLRRFCRLESDAVDSPRNYTLQTNDL